MEIIRNIDIHSHIISCVDDGAQSIDESLDMLRKSEQSGTSIIVATPHYYPTRGYEIEFDSVIKKVNELKIIAEKSDIDIEIVGGQEIGYTNDILGLYQDGKIGTINGTKYMLIEFPLSGFSLSEAIDNIYELQIKGIVPIIAHPERYERFQKNPEEINKLIDEGFLFQLNIGSFTGDFGSKAAKLAKIYVNHGLYSVLGSDGHRSEGRNTDMSKGIAALSKMSPGYTEAMNKNAEDIINDKSVRFNGIRVKNKRGIFNLLRR